jgi:O-methyltransferase
MNLQKRIRAQIKPVARSILERALHDLPLTDQVMAEWACRNGWRPPPLGVETDTYVNASFGYDDEENIKKAVSVVKRNTMVSFERLATLWLQVQHLDKHEIPGALVECGVWRGGSAGMMALAHLHFRSAPHRELHLFDSWQGLPEPDRELDGAVAAQYSGGASGGTLEPIGQCVAALDEVRQLLEKEVAYPPSLISYHVGWFQETLARTRIDQISLLRLDGDWYESTKVCLEHLYPKVVKGGTIVLDDYGYWAGCRKATDEFIATLPEPVMLHHIDADGRYFTKA